MEMINYQQIMKGREELLEALNKEQRSWTSTAAIAIVFPDSIHISPNQACHAGLSNNYKGNKNSGSIAVVSALMKPKDILDEEEAYYFLDWLLNRSPYHSTFITKSADEALYTKTIISSSDHPSNLMAAGLVASRRLWECAFIARVFVDLAKAGVNETLAYYLAHIFRGGFNRTGACDWGGNNSGHCSIDPYIMGEKQLLAFLNHKPVNLNRKFSESWSYNGYDAMYGRGNGHGYSHKIHKNFPYKAVEKVANANPFPLDKVYGIADNKSTAYDKLIEGMVEFQHTILKDIGYVKQEKVA